MLMELIREESDISRAAIRRSRTPSRKEEALDEGIVGVQMMDNRDALEIDTSACEDDADDARSVDEADIYKSAIDEGVSVSSAFSFCNAFRNVCLLISHHSWSSSCFIL